VIHDDGIDLVLILGGVSGYDAGYPFAVKSRRDEGLKTGDKYGFGERSVGVD
jgi:hypothetical protein